MSLSIDTKRLTDEIEYLAHISDTPYPSVTRVLFSSVDLRAREWLKLLYADAGLVVREDAVGNTFARWRARMPPRRPSPPARTSTRSPMPGVSTAWSGSSADWKPSAPCNAPAAGRGVRLNW